MSQNDAKLVRESVEFAARRESLNRSIETTGLFLLSGVSLGLFYLIASRLFFLPSPWLAMSAFSALGLASGVASALSRKGISLNQAAFGMDRRLGSSDVVLTVIETESLTKGPLGELALASAADQIRSVDLRKAYPFRMPSSGLFIFAVGLLAAASSLFEAALPRDAQIIAAQNAQARLIRNISPVVGKDISKRLEELAKAMESSETSSPGRLFEEIKGVRRTVEDLEAKVRLREEIELALRSASGAGADTDKDKLAEMIREKFGKSLPSEEELAALARKLRSAGKLPEGKEAEALDKALTELEQGKALEAYEQLLAMLKDMESMPEKIDIERLKVRLDTAGGVLADAYTKSGVDIAADLRPASVDGSLSRFHSAPAAMPGISKAALEQINPKYREIVRLYCTE